MTASVKHDPQIGTVDVNDLRVIADKSHRSLTLEKPWEPINTAPRDGTKIWVRRKYLDQLVIGWAVWDVPALCDHNPEAYPKMWLDPARIVKFPEPTEWDPSTQEES